MSRSRPSNEPRSDATDDIAGAVRDLAEEVRVLRQAVDELREEVQYGVRNLLGQPSPARNDRTSPRSVRADAVQFGEAIRRLGDDVEEGLSQDGSARVEAEAFAKATEGVEELVYCCDQPKLTWYGDPERPGIACENCGFPVAHEGDILCWADGSQEGESPGGAGPPPKKPSQPDSTQRELF